MPELIRHALKLEKWFADVQKEGRILVERNGKVREIVSIS